MPLMRRCCTYTMHEKCPRCGSRTRSAHPPRFSIEDKYGRYRRMAKSRAEGAEE
ncbi:MAG: nucleolar RNA-binding Nop10p family protein [Candidatus Aenigmarchaeota archaeon]|nr:nucleolar RNA-binding Nop10p family protein [Candidatus Aenigmarchaeota archaeon]